MTEALTGAEREAEIARRMGVVPEPVVAPIFPTLPDRIIAPGKAIAEIEETDTAETDEGQWRYRFPELRVPADGQSYFRGEGQFTYRYPPGQFGVEGERRAVAPVIPTAPSTAPYTAPLYCTSCSRRYA